MPTALREGPYRLNFLSSGAARGRRIQWRRLTLALRFVAESSEPPPPLNEARNAPRLPLPYAPRHPRAVSAAPAPLCGAGAIK